MGEIYKGGGVGWVGMGMGIEMKWNGLWIEKWGFGMMCVSLLLVLVILIMLYAAKR